MKVAVLLADTELLYCAGVADALSRQPDLHLLAVIQDQHSFEQALRQQQCVALVALSLITNWSSLLASSLASGSGIVLLLNRVSDARSAQLDEVNGFLLRSSSEQQLCECLRVVAAGSRCGSHILPTKPTVPTSGERVLALLSARQLQVVAGVSRGAKNAEIARVLKTSEQVIKNMLRDIFDIVGVSDRLELALFVLHQRELATAVEQAGRASGQIPSG